MSSFLFSTVCIFYRFIYVPHSQREDKNKIWAIQILNCGIVVMFCVKMKTFRECSREECNLSPIPNYDDLFFRLHFSYVHFVFGSAVVVVDIKSFYQRS